MRRASHRWLLPHCILATPISLLVSSTTTWPPLLQHNYLIISPSPFQHIQLSSSRTQPRGVPPFPTICPSPPLEHNHLVFLPLSPAQPGLYHVPCTLLFFPFFFSITFSSWDTWFNNQPLSSITLLRFPLYHAHFPYISLGTTRPYKYCTLSKPNKLTCILFHVLLNPIPSQSGKITAFTQSFETFLSFLLQITWKNVWITSPTILKTSEFVWGTFYTAFDISSLVICTQSPTLLPWAPSAVIFGLVCIFDIQSDPRIHARSITYLTSSRDY